MTSQSFFQTKFDAFAKTLNDGDMAKWGIGNTMKLAKIYNQWRRSPLVRFRKKQYRDHFETLLSDHAQGAPVRPPGRMADGWFLDQSHSLPHLPELLADAERIIAERGGHPPGERVKPFIVDIAKEEDLTRFPSILNFILSPEVLKIASDYLDFVPMLSTTMPPAARFVESSAKYDPGAGGPYRESQLFHLDHHDSPLVYVIVLLRDVTMESGPFHFIPAGASARAAKALGYRRRGAPYRVEDDQMYTAVIKEEVVSLELPKGTVLFMDSSRCFHYGSRDCTIPRYQMMYAFVSPCRTDFSEITMKPRVYPVAAGDSRLRQMVIRGSFAD